MNILITGGAGFIGGALARRLLAEGLTVVVVDNLSTSRIESVPSGAIFLEGDIGSVDTVKALPQMQYDAVCHLAAQSSGAVSMEDPVYDLKTNALSTMLLARWCREQGVRRFLYASSMAVYGNPTSLPVCETTELLPVSYYGASKLLSENVLRIAAKDGLASTAFRMFNVYGPGQNLANLRQGMASIYLAYMLKGVLVPVTGSLSRFRDFVYIEDVVDAWVTGLRLPATASDIYNIGSGAPTTVRDLLDLLKDACGLPPGYPIQEKDAPAGDQFGLYADCRLAEGELGWKAKMPLKEGLNRMAAWAKIEYGKQV